MKNNAVKNDCSGRHHKESKEMTVIDNQFANYIKKRAIKSVRYDIHAHKFTLPKVTLTKPELLEIKEEYERIIGKEDKTDEYLEIVNRVLKDIKFEVKKKPQISGINPETIPVLQHVVFKENSPTYGPSEIQMLCIGTGRFLVVADNRSGIQENDELVVLPNPWNYKAPAKFEVYRKKKRFPDKSTVFQSHELHSVEFWYPSEIYSVIDNFGSFSVEEGNTERETDTVSREQLQENVRMLLNEIEAVVASGTIEQNYPYLVKLARDYHIGSYVLHLLIETKDTQKEYYAHNAEDWVKNLSPYELKKIKEAERKKAEEIYKGFFQTKIDHRGKVSSPARMELNRFLEKNDLSTEWAQAFEYPIITARKTAYKQKKKKRNLLYFRIILVFAIVFSGYYFFRKQVTGFENRIQAGDQLVEAGYYPEAIEEYNKAYTLFWKRRTVSEKIINANIAKDSVVNKRIEQIKLLLKADRNRFNEITEEKLFEALRLSSDNEELLKLKGKWENQQRK